MQKEADDWTRMVRQRARQSGVNLSAAVIGELAAHLDEMFDREIDRGELPAAARARALAVLEATDFGALAWRHRARAQSDSRLSELERVIPGVFAGISCDVRYALRLLRRTPVFSMSLVGILALSLGATSAIYSVVDAVLLRPLPYPAADRLVMLSRVDKDGRRGFLSAADWVDFASRARAFEGVAAHSNWTHNLSGDGEPLRLRSIVASGNFFTVLGVAPQIGRVFTDPDDTPHATAVVVLSDGFWSRRFARDPGIIGHTLALNGNAATVIGVMPPAFEYPSRDVDLWMPLGIAPEVRADRASEWLTTIARLKNGVSMAAALDEAQALSAALAADFPKTNQGERSTLIPLIDHVVGNVRQALLVVSGAVALVFLITCFNVANLLLARASVRRDEMVLRYAMGANRWRLVRQVLVESAACALIAATASIALAWALLRGFGALAADRVPRISDLGVHAGSIAAAAGACALVIAASGVAAAFAFGRAQDMAPRSSPRLARAQGLRPVLLAAQIAFSCVLVSSAVLLAGSYVRLQHVPIGFESEDVLSLRVSLPRQKYPDNAAHARFAEAVTTRLVSLPGVAGAGVINDLPLAGNQMSFAVAFEGRPSQQGPPVRATVREADPGFFDVLQIPVIEGRGIHADDRADREPVAVLNRTAARAFFPEGPIGQRIQLGGVREWRRVVGVVADIRHAGLQKEEGPAIYLPYAQKPFEFVSGLGVLVRGPSVDTLVRSVRAQLASIDPTQPIYDVMLVSDYLARARAPYRLNMWIVGALAALSIALAIAGVFALTSYTSSARHQEFGIRIALGASQREVRRLVLSQALRVGAAGTSIGIAGAYYAGASLTTLLFEMTASDPRIYMMVGLAFLSITVAAALPSALRAAAVDPAAATRAQ